MADLLSQSHAMREVETDWEELKPTIILAEGKPIYRRVLVTPRNKLRIAYRKG